MFKIGILLEGGTNLDSGLLNNSFKALIDYGVPVGVKITGEILKSMENNRLNSVKEYQATSNLLKRAFIKEHNISEFDEIIYNYEGALEIIEYGKTHKDMWEYTYLNMKEGINDLVKIQHRIIEILRKGDEEFKATFLTTNLSVFNHFIKLYKELNNPNFVNRYRVWDIPKKGNENSENGDNVYLSEDEVETIAITIKTQ